MIIIYDEGNLAKAEFTCEVVINAIASRVRAGIPESDEDNFETIFTGPPSGNNSAGSLPSTSQIQQVIQTPRRQLVIGLDTISPSRMRQGYMRPRLSPGSVALPQPLEGSDDF